MEAANRVFSLGNEMKLRSLLESAGFRDVEIATEAHRFALPSFATYFEPIEQGAGSPGQAFVSLPKEARFTVREEVRRDLCDTGGPIDIEVEYRLADGGKGRLGPFASISSRAFSSLPFRNEFENSSRRSSSYGCRRLSMSSTAVGAYGALCLVLWPAAASSAEICCSDSLLLADPLGQPAHLSRRPRAATCCRNFTGVQLK
jgi:hypothetical protein